MLKLIAVCSGVLGSVIAFGGDRAAAQSTSTCMAMGRDMIQCNTMDMSTDDDGAVLLGKAVRKLILGDKEKAFRRKIGKLLADGDCQGAARLALQDGQLELGQSIMASCRPNSARLSSASPATRLAPGSTTSNQASISAPVTSFTPAPQAPTQKIAPAQSAYPAAPPSADPYERTVRIWIDDRIIQLQPEE